MLQLWKSYFQQKGAWWVNYSNNKTVFSLSSPTSLGGVSGRVKFWPLCQKTSLQTWALQPLCPTSSKGFAFQWAQVCGNSVVISTEKWLWRMNVEKQEVNKLGGECMGLPLGKQKPCVGTPSSAPSTSEDLVAQKLQRGCEKMVFGWGGIKRKSP